MQLRVKSLRHTYLITVPEVTLTAIQTQLPAEEWTDKQFLHNGIELHESTDLASLGVTAGNEVLMVISAHTQRFCVVFTYKKTQFTHICGGTTTVGKLRQVCCSRLGFGLDFLRLCLHSEVLPDQQEVRSLGTKPVLDIWTSSRPTGYEHQMLIKTLTGKTHCINIDYSFTVGHVKELLAERGEGAPSTLRLIFAGKQLSDQDTIESTGAGRERSFHLVPRLR